MRDKLENFLSEVQLIVQDDLSGEAYASITLNPHLRWMKFILLDDQPNENKERVPQKEFENIIKTGVNMPLKMAEGAIADGHEDAKPIGVITHLMKVKNRIEGLAALWSRERPEDIEFILEEFNKGVTPQVSYELPYQDIEETEAGVKDLLGTSLRGVALVRIPAFAGRTPVVAMAAKEAGESDTKLEDDKLMDELEALKQQYAEAQDTIKELNDELAELKESQASVNEELEELRGFKAEIDKLAEEADKLDKVEQKFTEAGIKRDEEYFDTNKELLLSLDETALDFMVQELVAFASEEKEDKTPDIDNDDAIPPLTPDKDTTPQSMKDLAKALNEELTK